MNGILNIIDYVYVKQENKNVFVQLLKIHQITFS